MIHIYCVLDRGVAVTLKALVGRLMMCKASVMVGHLSRLFCVCSWVFRVCMIERSIVVVAVAGSVVSVI